MLLEGPARPINMWPGPRLGCRALPRVSDRAGAVTPEHRQGLAQPCLGPEKLALRIQSHIHSANTSRSYMGQKLYEALLAVVRETA